MAARDDGARDRRHLIGRLALAEDDFRKPLARCPMMVDAREAEVLERVGERRDPLLGLGGIEAPVAHGFEERPERGERAGSRVGRMGHGAFDSAGNRFLQ